MSKALKKLAGQTAIYGVSSILSRILHYVLFTIYLTRFISTTEFGVFTEMYFYVAILVTLMAYRMDTALFRYGRKKEKLNTTFSTASISLLISTFFLSVLFYFNAQNIANLLSYPDHSDYVKILTGVIAFDVISSIAFAKLRLENRPIKFATLKTLNIIINIVAIFIFLEVIPYLIEKNYNGLRSFYNKDELLDYVFLSNIIASGITFLFLIPEFLKVKFVFDKALWKKMVVYSLPLVLVGIAAVVNQSIAVPIQKYLLPGGLDENLSSGGIYGAAAKIAILMNLFTYAFNYAAEPFFFSHAEKSDSRTIYAQVAQAFSIVACIIFLGILFYLDLIKLILGEEFRGGMSVVPILLISYLFLGLYYNFSIWYKLTDKTKYGAAIAWGGSMITFLINYLFLTKYGFIASAWAALACYGFMVVAAYYYGQKYYPIDYPIKKISFYILSAIGIYYLSLYINTTPNLGLKMVINTTFLLGYIVLIFVLDKKAILGLLKRK